MAASVDTIIGVIRWRIKAEGMEFLRLKHGDATVEDALSSVGEHYAGVEEIGSSDAWAMVRTFLVTLGENPKDHGINW